MLESIVLKRKCKREKFVIDGFADYAGAEIAAVLGALKAPSMLIDLDCKLDAVKIRYKIKNELDELTEDQVEEIEKAYQAYEGIRNMLLEQCKQSEIFQVETMLSEERALKDVDAIFAPKILIFNHHKYILTDALLANISWTNNIVYLSVYQLIKEEIQKKSDLGIKLLNSKRERMLKEEYYGKDEFNEAEYCPAYFSLNLVIELIKMKLKQLRNAQK
jgi:hypothetical protein